MTEDSGALLTDIDASDQKINTENFKQRQTTDDESFKLKSSRKKSISDNMMEETLGEDDVNSVKKDAVGTGELLGL